MMTKILKAASIISAFSLLSRLVGLLRDRILAGQFGAGNELDIYYAAFRIPDFLYQIFVAGAISAVFIPIFLDYFKKNKEEAYYFSSVVMNFFCLFLIGAAILLIIFTPYLMKIIAPGFIGEKRLMAISITRIMFFSPLFLGLSAILSSVLQARQKFFIFSISPILYNFGIIIGAVFLAPKIGLAGLAWGVVLGAFMHFAVQLPSAIHSGFRPRAVFNFSHPGLQKMLKLAVPRIFGLAVSQINVWVMTAFASTLGVGAIAIFNLAQNLQNVPVGFVGIPLAIAIFPVLSELASDKKDFKKKINKTLLQILVLILPAILIFYFFSDIIIKIILGTGRFSQDNVELTARVLSIFAFGLLGEALIPFLARGFYAIQDTLTPVLISLFSVALNIGAAFYLLSMLQNKILALPIAFSISSIVNAALLFLFLNRRN